MGLGGLSVSENVDVRGTSRRHHHDFVQHDKSGSKSHSYFGSYAPARPALSVQEVTEIVQQLKALNSSQLELETTVRELEVNGDVFRRKADLVEDARIVESYVNHVIRDWERSGHTIVAGSSTPVLDGMPALRDFLAHKDPDKSRTMTFASGASEPMERIQKAIQSELLSPKRVTPSSLKRTQ